MEPDFTITNVSIHGFGESKFNQGGFGIEWGTVSAGFGNVGFYIDNNGKLKCENECMSKAFILSVFKKLIDSAEMQDKNHNE